MNNTFWGLLSQQASMNVDGDGNDTEGGASGVGANVPGSLGQNLD